MSEQNQILYDDILEPWAVCPECGRPERGYNDDGVKYCTHCGALEGTSLKEVWCPANCGGSVIYEEGLFRCTGCGATVRIDCEGVEPWDTEGRDPAVSDFRIRRLKGAEVLPGIRFLSSQFREFTELERVFLPEGIEETFWGAFALCVSLKEINIPQSLRKLGGKAFCGCTALDEIVLPEGLTEIGEYAFWGCTNLRQIKLPRGASIGESAFDDCPKLTIEYYPE